MNKYMIQLNEDQLIEVKLFNIIFERERIPLVADNTGLLYEIGEFLNVWIPSGDRALINPENPPLLLNSGSELISNNQPNMNVVKKLYSIAHDLGDLYYIDIDVVGIDICDKYKYDNTVDYANNINEWIIYHYKDYLEYVRDAFRNNYRRLT